MYDNQTIFSATILVCCSCTPASRDGNPTSISRLLPNLTSKYAVEVVANYLLKMR
jgi:predicted metal-binding protein